MTKRKVIVDLGKIEKIERKIKKLELVCGRKPELTAEIEDLTVKKQKHIKQLQTALDEVQGRCSARTITVKQIIERMSNYKWNFERDMTHKEMDGICVKVNLHYVTMPRAYKYAPMSTWFAAEFKNGSWRILEVWRGRCDSYEFRSWFPAPAQQAILRKYCCNWWEPFEKTEYDTRAEFINNCAN